MSGKHTVEISWRERFKDENEYVGCTRNTCKSGLVDVEQNTSQECSDTHKNENSCQA